MILWFPVKVLLDSNECGHGTNYKFESMFADKTRSPTDAPEPLHVPTKQFNLVWGDYSLEGHESRVIVERKALSDLFGTLTARRDAFENQVQEMAKYDVADIIVEANLGDIIKNPPEHSQADPKTILRTVLSWKQKYRNVHWTFCADRWLAERVTFRILERYFLNLMTEKEQKRFCYQRSL